MDSPLGLELGFELDLFDEISKKKNNGQSSPTPLKNEESSRSGETESGKEKANAAERSETKVTDRGLTEREMMLLIKMALDP